MLLLSLSCAQVQPEDQDDPGSSDPLWQLVLSRLDLATCLQCSTTIPHHIVALLSDAHCLARLIFFRLFLFGFGPAAGSSAVRRFQFLFRVQVPFNFD